jgi:hypothetical protein
MNNNICPKPTVRYKPKEHIEDIEVIQKVIMESKQAET